MFVVATLFGNRVVAASAPGIATQDAFYAEIASVKQAVHLQRLDKIGRTSRRIAATGRQERRDAGFVKADQHDQRKYEDFF